MTPKCAVVLWLAVGMTMGDVVRVAESSTRQYTLVPCDTPGWSCLDCSTRLLCTPLGAIPLPCWLPGPHCVAGVCARDPSDQCTSTTPPALEPTTGAQPTEEYPDSTTTNLVNSGQ